MAPNTKTVRRKIEGKHNRPTFCRKTFHIFYGEDISFMCDMLRSPRNHSLYWKMAWPTEKWKTASHFSASRGKKRYDMESYLQIHHLDTCSSNGLVGGAGAGVAAAANCYWWCDFCDAFFLPRHPSLFADENNSSNHTKDTRQHNTRMHMLAQKKKGSTWKRKYNQECLLCLNCRRNIFFFFSFFSC